MASCANYKFKESKTFSNKYCARRKQSEFFHDFMVTLSLKSLAYLNNLYLPDYNKKFPFLGICVGIIFQDE